MKFSNLVKTEDGKIVTVDLEMSDQENQFFLGVAFNTLLTQGLIKLNEQTSTVDSTVVPKTDTVVEKGQNEDTAA